MDTEQKGSMTLVDVACSLKQWAIYYLGKNGVPADDADELLQVWTLRLYRASPKYVGMHIERYAKHALTNLIRDYHKRQKKAHPFIEEVFPEGYDCPDESPSPEDIVETHAEQFARRNVCRSAETYIELSTDSTFRTMVRRLISTESSSYRSTIASIIVETGLSRAQIDKVLRDGLKSLRDALITESKYNTTLAESLKLLDLN